MNVPLKVGDKIIYTKFSAVEVKNDGEDFYLVNERDILGVIE